jgi:hypothetical protein
MAPRDRWMGWTGTSRFTLDSTIIPIIYFFEAYVYYDYFLDGLFYSIRSLLTLKMKSGKQERGYDLFRVYFYSEYHIYTLKIY